MWTRNVEAAPSVPLQVDSGHLKVATLRRTQSLPSDNRAHWDTEVREVARSCAEEAVTHCETQLEFYALTDGQPVEIVTDCSRYMAELRDTEDESSSSVEYGLHSVQDGSLRAVEVAVAKI